MFTWPRNANGDVQPPIFPRTIDGNTVWAKSGSWALLTKATEYQSAIGQVWYDNYRIWQQAVQANAWQRLNPNLPISAAPLSKLAKQILAGAVNGYLRYPPLPDDFTARGMSTVMALNGQTQARALEEMGFSTTDMPIQQGEMPELDDSPPMF